MIIEAEEIDMSGNALNVNVATETDLSDLHLFDDTEQDADPGPGSVDARRKLEDKLEELRLQRDLKEFDFDF